MTNYILGFGISGAVAAFYLPNFKVITRPVHIGIHLQGPQYIYDTSETRRLLKDLEIPINTKTIKAGYLVNGEIKPPSKEILIEYYRHVRGGSCDNRWLEEHLKWKFNILDCLFVDVIAKIYQLMQDNIIEDVIISVDLEHKRLIGMFDEYKYDKLICTIPLPELSRLAGLKTNLKWKPIVMAVQHKKDFSFDIYSTDFDYVYLVGKQPYRISKFIDPYVVSEYTTKEAPAAFYKKVIPYGKIIGGEVPDLSEFDVYLVGRFAKWDKTYKVHDAIRDVKKLAEVL